MTKNTKEEKVTNITKEEKVTNIKEEKVTNMLKMVKIKQEEEKTNIIKLVTNKKEELVINKKTTMETMTKEKVLKEGSICLDGRGLGRVRTLMTSNGTERWKMVNSFFLILSRTFFFKYVIPGEEQDPKTVQGPRPKVAKTVWTRVTRADVEIHYVVEMVAKFMAKKQDIKEAFEAYENYDLLITYKGKPLRGDEILEEFEERSMFLLTRVQDFPDTHLPEYLKDHKGKVWQCLRCGKADNKRGNVARTKCSSRHKFLFYASQEFKKLGDHVFDGKGKLPMHAPLVSRAPPTPPQQVSKSFSCLVCLSS